MAVAAAMAVAAVEIKCAPSAKTRGLCLLEKAF
jgi:hypothetical protein